ncbi:MAG: hypothetical protein WC724_00670 [Candidatus Paceibacterota bacterium]|jgi:hypothetical protein
MHQQGSGSSRSFAARRANYFAGQGTQAQPMSGGTGVAANDPKATSAEEEIVVDPKESPAKHQKQ